MANTYTQIHIHSIFAVQNRQSLIQSSWETELYKYITGIVQNHGHKLLQINGMPDHIHLLIGMRPVQSLSELTQQIKQDSSKWINKQRLVAGRFSWQEGFGAFSHSKSQVQTVITYIQNQKNHHKKKNFREEYIELLEKWEVDYDERYIFKPIEWWYGGFSNRHDENCHVVHSQFKHHIAYLRHADLCSPFGFYPCIVPNGTSPIIKTHGP